MNFLSINNLSKIGREKPLFTGVTFGIQEGEKAALIGRNGTGKSTLLNTIAGVYQPDEGTVTINKECGVSFLPQNPLFNGEDTIRQHIFRSDSPKLRIIREYEEVCLLMADEAAAQKASVQKRYEEIMQKMDVQDLWNYEAQISSILSTLGISDLERKMKELSGGMVKKVALAQVLVEDTKLLLLDEPTNHLDISTIAWLQNYLHDMKRSLLMVTHDRYFLDAVCTNIYELDRNSIKLYEGNYSQYLEKKQTEAEIEANTERRIEAVLRFERDWLLRGPCARGTKAKARIQRDMQLINREKFAADKGFTFEVQGRRLGGKVLELKHISKNFAKSGVAAKWNGGAKGSTDLTQQSGTGATAAAIPVIQDFSYVFTAGQKIGVFGDNGSGKSTFLNIVTGAIPPDTGTLDVGVNTKFGYYTQNPVFKDTTLTVLEYIKETAEHIVMNDGKELSAPRFLEEFGFEGKIQHSPVSSLSGGERKRLYLVRLLLQNPNFLVLDEPTNDFDIFTMNILEQFLMNYKGCLLLVSHDRYFMDKCVDSLFIMENDGSISGFVGKCSEYVEYREELLAEKKRGGSLPPVKSFAKANILEGVGGESLPLASAGKPSSATPSSGQNAPSQVARNAQDSSNLQTNSSPAQKKKLSFKEQREFEALDAQIPELEAQQKELEAQMTSTDFTVVQTASAKYAELTQKLEEMYLRWEELSANL